MDWDILYLDHDLGDFENGVERTGLDVMKWILNNLDHAPRKVVCVSANPIGKKNIEGYVKDLERLRRIIG